jgi:3-oxoacyl-[acyl-carrier protein] reductase
MNRIDLGGQIAIVTGAARGIGCAIAERFSAEAQIDYMLSKIPMGRFVRVEEIAALVAWLASEECSFSTGGVFDISSGRAEY